MRACSSGVIGRLWSGAHQFGVRWNTVRWPTVLAISVMACTAVAPVPITATRLLAKLTGSCGQRPVWWASPRKLSTPGIVGMVGADSGPIAVIQQARPHPPAVVRALDRPLVGRLVVHRGAHPAAELDVPPQVELVGHEVAVAERLRLGREVLAPLPLAQDLLREG